MRDFAAGLVEGLEYGPEMQPTVALSLPRLQRCVARATNPQIDVSDRVERHPADLPARGSLSLRDKPPQHSLNRTFTPIALAFSLWECPIEGSSSTLPDSGVSPTPSPVTRITSLLEKQVIATCPRAADYWIFAGKGWRGMCSDGECVALPAFSCFWRFAFCWLR